MTSFSWPTKLALFIEEKREQPFNWKENNCGFFCCDWLAIRTGKDPAAALRLLSAKELVRLMRETSLSALADKIATERGWPQVAPLHAHRGDIVEYKIDGVPALGVCDGVRSWFAGKEGLVEVYTAFCSRAWRIL